MGRPADAGRPFFVKLTTIFRHEGESTMTKSTYDKDAAKTVLATVKSLQSQGLDWMALSNAIYAADGVFAKSFPVGESRTAFMNGPEYAEIRKILASLPMPHETAAGGVSGKFMVRLPQSIHAALQAEAEAEGVSLNQLVLAKLSIGLGEKTAQLKQQTKKKAKSKNAA